MRVSTHGMFLAFLATALLAAPVLAEEVVHLKNGTYMTISSHAIEGEMLHVTLGSDAQMAFPLYMIDRIEAGGELVPLTAEGNSGRTVSNQMVDGPEGAAGGANSASSTAGPPMTGALTVPSRKRGGGSPETAAAARSNGGLVHYQNGAGAAAQDDGVYRPYGDSPNENLRRVSAVGNTGIRSASDQFRAGGRQTLPAPGAPTRKAKPMSFQPKKAPPPPTPAGASSGSDAADSGSSSQN